MEEHVEAGHVDAQPTEDLSEARDRALAAHRDHVEQHAAGEEQAKEAAKDAADQVDHAVADDPDEMQVSGWFDPDPEKERYLRENPPQVQQPYKDERPATPVPDVTDRSKDAEPVPVVRPEDVPRGEGTLYDDKDAAEDAANYDVEETNKKEN